MKPKNNNNKIYIIQSMCEEATRVAIFRDKSYIVCSHYIALFSLFATYFMRLMESLDICRNSQNIMENNSNH